MRLLHSVADLRHERVLDAARETSSSSASESGGLDLINNPIGSVQQNVLSLVPVSLITVKNRSQFGLRPKVPKYITLRSAPSMYGVSSL